MLHESHENTFPCNFKFTKKKKKEKNTRFHFTQKDRSMIEIDILATNKDRKPQTQDNRYFVDP